MNQVNKRYGQLTTFDKVFDIIIVVFAILVLILILFPFLNLFAISLSDGNAVLRGEIGIIPKGLNFKAYKELFGNAAVLRSFKNTVLVAVGSAGFGVIMTILAAYPMAFGKFPGKKIYTLFVLIPHWFVAGMIPTYMVVKELGLIDSHWALVLISLVTPYHVIILTSFMRSLPGEIIESAKIDGANDLRILLQIVVPLCKAAIATVALWIVVASWNDFINPLMYLTDFKKYTLQIVLRDIVMASQSSMYELGGVSADGGVAALSEQMKNAMIGVSILPMLFFYPFIQKYFVAGVTVGSVKG